MVTNVHIENASFTKVAKFVSLLNVFMYMSGINQEETPTKKYTYFPKIKHVICLRPVGLK